MKSLKILLVVGLTVAVILMVGVGLLYLVRPTPELGGQPDKFTIGTAIIVVGYVMFPILAVLAPALLFIALLLLIANAREAATPFRVVVDQFFIRKRLQWKTERGYRYTFKRFDRWRAGARFMQHRARGSTAKLLQRRGVPLNVIQQIGGWESPEMVRRYIGDYSVEELKTFPTVGLDQILMPDKDRGLPQAS